MARLHRQELKADEFVSGFEETLYYLEEHREAIVIGVLAVLFGGLGLGGFWWQARAQEEQASAALGAAMRTFDARVQPPLPGPGPQAPPVTTPGGERIFRSEKEKYEAAKKELGELRASFPWTRSALVAKHYEAVADFRLGQHDAALAALEELAQGSDDEAAALARFHLAGFYSERNRPADAEKHLRHLVAHPAATAPKSAALIALGDLLAAAKPAEARALYEEAQKELEGTPLATQLKGRLDSLPRAAPPAPASAQP